MFLDTAKRWTPFIFLWPKRYIDPHATIAIDLETWSDTFEWSEDPWNGYQDFAQPVRQTIQSREGDCEDYSLVAASWLVSRGEDVELVCCFDENFAPTHVVCYDGERVYSSGAIFDKNLDEYLNWAGFRASFSVSIPG